MNDTIHTSQDKSARLSPVGNEIPQAHTIKTDTGEIRHIDTGAKEYGKPSQRDVFEAMLADGVLTLKEFPTAASVNKEVGKRWSAAHNRPDAGNCQYLVNRTRAGYTPDTGTGCWRVATPEERDAYLLTLGTHERNKALSGLLPDGECEKMMAEVESLKGSLPNLPTDVAVIIQSRIESHEKKILAHKTALADLANQKAAREMRAAILDRVTNLVKGWQAQGAVAPLTITILPDGTIA